MAYKKMTKQELAKFSGQAIDEQVAKLNKELFELRTQAVTERLENPHELGVIRRDVARLLTKKRADQIAASPAADQ